MENHTAASDYQNQYSSGLKAIAYLVAGVVLILSFIFFIRAFTFEKNKVVKNMYEESGRIEKRFKENLYHTSYIMRMIADQIKQSPEDYEYISNILNRYRTNPNVTNILSWTYFFWIDRELQMRANSIEGYLEKPVDENVTGPVFLSSITPNKLFFGSTLYGRLSKKKVLPTVMGQTDDEGNYIGTLMVSYDVKNLTERLKDALKDENVNFAFIDYRLRVIFKSKPEIPKIGITDNVIVSNNIYNLIKKMNFYSDQTTDFSYVDVFTGRNYYLKKVPDLPFVMIISLDPYDIRNNILNTLIHKFIEISIFASFFLILVVAIYKRETWLRNKAERATEIAIKATNAKTDFLAFTAHEIRSPLGFILTGSEIMQKELFGSFPDKYKEYINGIHQNARLILDFISDILDESHITEGKFKIENKVTDIEQLIDKCITTNKTRFTDRKVNIYPEIHYSLPQLICDDRRISQCLNNLISNAIKYSRDFTKVIVKGFVKNNKLFISVVDEGVGMSEEEVKVAFSRFGTVRRKNFNIMQSYGLGLPIVKKLVEAHNAELLVKSQPGMGTTITMMFPEEKVILSNEQEEIDRKLLLAENQRKQSSNKETITEKLMEEDSVKVSEE